MTGVSFVIPVRNGAAYIADTLDSVFAQADGRPLEVIVVEDGSDDGSRDVIRKIAEIRPLRVIAGPRRGAAAALNAGVRAARFPIICQVDQDVVLGRGWMPRLVAAVEQPGIAAAQGRYVADPRASLFVRVMGWDLEQRYAGIGACTNHVCTGNSAYRVEALRQAGEFDETLGYGYDNDMSYRLMTAGYGLAFCRRACSVHRWREGFIGYLSQQYGFGYGRIDLIAKHPGRILGDTVSPARMILQPVLLSIAFALLLLGFLAAGVEVGPTAFNVTAAGLFVAIFLERLVAGIAAASRFRTAVPLLFPVVHLVRDCVWIAAIAVWLYRRLLREPVTPGDSMWARASRHSPRLLTDETRSACSVEPTSRVLALIPAHNEAASLPALVGELRSRRPDLEILVIDDGSTDGTADVLETLAVRWLRFPERMGIGAAVRAGLRYAVRLGFTIVVRLDGDGQHRPDDIEPLLGPIRRHESDVALGTRFLESRVCRTENGRWLRRPLAACLTAITGRRITDPTSGCYAFGPRAVRLLAEHHPTGYPEPELHLFLSSNGLTVMEVPVSMRLRANGRTSLTASRLAVACARVLLAMIIVPLRRTVREVP